jgi:hypothetical protein
LRLGSESGLSDNSSVTATISEVQKDLPKLIQGLDKSGDLFILDGTQVVAKLASVVPPATSFSLRDIQPASVGAILAPIKAAGDDLLGEMLERE